MNSWQSAQVLAKKKISIDLYLNNSLELIEIISFEKLMFRNKCKKSLSLKSVLLWEKMNFENNHNFSQNNSNTKQINNWLLLWTRRTTSRVFKYARISWWYGCRRLPEKWWPEEWGIESWQQFRTNSCFTFSLLNSLWVCVQFANICTLRTRRTLPAIHILHY